MDPLRNAEESYRDELFECLADPSRQRVVRHLREHGRSSVDDLAAAVAGAADEDRRVERTRLGLHHNHLPKLEAAGVLEYDQASETVRPTDRIEAADALVETVGERPTPEDATVGVDGSGGPGRLDRQLD